MTTASPVALKIIIDGTLVYMTAIDGVPVGWVATDGVSGRLFFDLHDDPTSTVDFLLPMKRRTSAIEIDAKGRMAANKNSLVTSWKSSENKNSKKLL